MSKTRRMRAVEERIGRPLEDVLRELVEGAGVAEAARRLGVSKATIRWWMLRLGLRRRVVVERS